MTAETAFAEQPAMTMTKFNENEAELKALAEAYKWLKIDGIDDVLGAKVLKEARLVLRDRRVTIAKVWKAMRDWANAFAKAVIAKEKELIDFIEPIEQELKQEEERIANLLEIEKRKSELPDRKLKLLELNIEKDDDFILSMDYLQFSIYLNDEKSKILAIQKEAQDKEAARIAAEQAKIDEQKRIDAAKLEAEERTRKEFEAKAISEKAEAARKEQEEARLKEENEKKLQADIKYQQFLWEHGYMEQTKAQYHIENKDGKIVLYKKVWELVL